MLTVDLVRWRRRGEQLEVRSPGDAQIARVRPVAEALIAVTKAHVGQPRAELKAAWAAVDVATPDRKLVDGLIKLIEDRCDFEAALTVAPVELRAVVFESAAAARQALPAGAPFERELVLKAAADALDLTVAQVEGGLFADLRDAHALMSFAALSADQLLAEYELAQHQAVLLRATRVIAEVRCDGAAAYRQLFRKLKFRRLLYRIERIQGGYRLEIDGPHSLLQSVTKYGLQLALVLPAIRSCAAWSLTADLRWGKEQIPLTYSLAGEAAPPPGRRSSPPLPEEVEALVARFRKLDCGWQVKVGKRVLDLPGVGVCVPDLEFTHPERPQPVYLEVMGYWSRAAVWQRVELVEAGLPDRVIFAVSKHLRVSEAVLDDELPGSLYVYANVLSAREILRRLEA